MTDDEDHIYPTGTWTTIIIIACVRASFTPEPTLVHTHTSPYLIIELVSRTTHTHTHVYIHHQASRNIHTRSVSVLLYYNVHYMINNTGWLIFFKSVDTLHVISILINRRSLLYFCGEARVRIRIFSRFVFFFKSNQILKKQKHAIATRARSYYRSIRQRPSHDDGDIMWERSATQRRGPLQK